MINSYNLLSLERNRASAEIYETDSTYANDPKELFSEEYPNYKIELPVKSGP